MALLLCQGNADPSKDNMLRITNDGRNLALDQRQMNPLFPDEPDSKVNRCVDNVFHIWQETTPQKSAQMIFCDLSTPKPRGTGTGAPHFSIYQDMKDKLVTRGVPESEVAFIHDAATDVQKAELFAKVRAGQVRVLLGSTAKMGAGTNAQTRLVALHHLDVPWRPSDILQRDGRILRQGNQNPTVDIFRYVTEGTFDAYSWQLVEGKQKFIGQIMTSKSPARSCENVDSAALSFAEVKALAAGNPKIKQKMDLDVEISRLTILRSSYQSEHYRLEDQLLKYFPANIAAMGAQIREVEKDLETRNAHACSGANEFSIEIGGAVYQKKEAAGEALAAAAKEVRGTEAVLAGTYRGFGLAIRINVFSHAYLLELHGAGRYSADMGTDAAGNMARLNNLLDRLDEQLAVDGAPIESTEEYVFHDIAQDHTLEASFFCPSAQYEDLIPARWYHTPVDFVLNRKYMVGTTAELFEPDAVLTRAQMVTLLARVAEAKLDPLAITMFQDVEDGAWYVGAVAWATAQGVGLGYVNEQFGPDKLLTREQLAAMLWRYAGYPELDVSAVDFAAFPDGDNVSTWAREAVGWAVGAGLLKGDGRGYLLPTGNATRAEAAAIIQRFVETR